MPSFLYDAGPSGLWMFLLCTVLLGGGAAFVSGRAIAQTWRPIWQLPVYMLLLAFAVRFIHFALFEERLMSLKNLLVAYVVLLALALTGYKSMRARQMDIQYGWLRAKEAKPAPESPGSA